MGGDDDDDDDGMWICDECVLGGAIFRSGTDGRAAEKESWVADGISDAVLLEEGTARLSKRKRDDDDTLMARKTRSSSRKVAAEIAVVPGCTHILSPEPSHGIEKEICICGTPASDEMVACDGAGCACTWFHFECVGMTAVTVPEGKWFCEGCVEKQSGL